VARLVRSTPTVATGAVVWLVCGSSVGWRRWPGELQLHYRCEGREYVERFGLSAHTPGLGGEVVLPHCSGCDARVRFLFLDLALGGFRCRTCCGLKYRSQYDAGLYRRFPWFPRRRAGADEPAVRIEVDARG